MPRPSATAWWRSTWIPLTLIVLGPGPIVRWNVAAMIDDSNVEEALALAYGTEDIDVEDLLIDTEACYARSSGGAVDLSCGVPPRRP